MSQQSREPRVDPRCLRFCVDAQQRWREWIKCEFAGRYRRFLPRKNHRPRDEPHRRPEPSFPYWLPSGRRINDHRVATEGHPYIYGKGIQLL